MRREELLFRAASWSQEGRPSRDAREVLDGLSNMTHKHQPGTDKTELRKRLTYEISVQCQTGLVNMIHACIQRPSGQAAWICLGIDTTSDHDASLSTTSTSDDGPL